MKKPLLVAMLILSFSALFIATGCKKTTPEVNSAPTVTTTDIILDVTSTSAQSGGTITAVGTAFITANGVCYSSTNQLPTIADSKTSDPIISSSYTFESNLADLTPNTDYYVRAYATNIYGTSYGSVIKFTTSATLSSVAGAVTTFAGNASGGFADGTGTAAQFSNPQGLAVDVSGNIYVADSFNNRIRKVTPGGVVTTIAGNGIAGYVDGTGTDAEFYGPQGLTVDAAGNIYVADFGNNVIRKITPAGEVSTFAGNTTAGYVNGAAGVAEFNGPAAVAFDASSNLYVADFSNNMIRKITAAGVVSLVAGTTTAGYVNTTVDADNSAYGAFKHPNGIALDAAGNIYVADLGNNAIRKITAAGVITTIGGSPVQSAVIGLPAGIAIDAQGNFFITDKAGRILELTSAGILYNLAGTSGVAGFTDGTGAAAKFNAPTGVAADAAGNIYVADFNNNSIRKVVVTSTNH